MASRFAAHGTLNLSLSGNILTVEGRGPWNLESLRCAAEELKPQRKLLESAPWGVLVILHGEPIYLPPAVTDLIESIIQEKQVGRTATAVLVNSCDAPGFAKLHMSDIYGKAEETFEFFDDIDDAKDWLAQQIEQASSSS